MALSEKQILEDKIPTKIEKTEKVQYHAPYHGDEEEHIELDLIEQLKANINQLSELQDRLQYMNKELQGLITTRRR